MFAKSTKFSLKGTLDSQMSELNALRASDPVKCCTLFKLGDELIQLAASGQLRKIVQRVNSVEDGDVFFYFVAKMLHSALINGHLMIATFILDQGYPLHSSVVPNVLLETLEVVDDTLAILIIEFLVLANGVDVNSQAKKSYITALHIAVKRGLEKTILFLLDHGADVNAVADGDSMPLILAEALDSSVTARNSIIAILLKSGARKTWRKEASTSSDKKVFKSFSGGDGGTNFNTFNPPTQNSMVSFRGGGDTTGVFNIGSSVTSDCIGYRQNNSYVSTTVDVRTSTSLAPANLAEVLLGESTSNNEGMTSSANKSIHSNDRNRKIVHFSSSLEGSRPISGIRNGGGINNLDLSLHNLTIAEPKELPMIRSRCDFSSNTYHSRERENESGQNIPQNTENENENEEEIVDSNEEDGRVIDMNTNDESEDKSHCPYQLSDDGAFIFSTN